MINKYIKFTGIDYTLSLDKCNLFCVYDLMEHTLTSPYILYNGVYYRYAFSSVLRDKVYSIYEPTEITAHMLLNLSERCNLDTIIEVIN